MHVHFQKVEWSIDVTGLIIHSPKTKVQYIFNMPTQLWARIQNNLTILILLFFSMYNAHAESIMHVHHLLIIARNSAILILLSTLLIKDIWSFYIKNNPHALSIMHILNSLSTVSRIPILILLTTLFIMDIWPFCIINNTHALSIMHILHLMDTASSIPILILLNTGSLLPSGSIIIVDNAYAILIMHFGQLGVSVEHPLFTRKKVGIGVYIQAELPNWT